MFLYIVFVLLWQINQGLSYKVLLEIFFRFRSMEILRNSCHPQNNDLGWPGLLTQKCTKVHSLSSLVQHVLDAKLAFRIGKLQIC